MCSQVLLRLVLQFTQLLYHVLQQVRICCYLSDYYQLFTVLPQEEYALLGVEVGIPVTFLLTAIISSLLTLLITYQCLTRRGGRFAPPVQEPAYDPVSVSSTRRLETHNNVAYGAVTDSRSASYI